MKPSFPDRHWGKIGIESSRIMDYWLAQEPPRFDEIDKVLAWASRHPRLTLVLSTGQPERLAAYCRHAIELDGADWAELGAPRIAFPMQNVWLRLDDGLAGDWAWVLEQAAELSDVSLAYCLTFTESDSMRTKQRAAIKARQRHAKT